MVRISPFKGIYFNKKKIDNIGKVVTQPYDKIDEKLQNRYYERSEFNVVRLVKGKEEIGDNKGNNKYTRAKSLFDKWLNTEVLLQEKKPIFYAYNQIFKVDNEHVTRKGLTCLVELEEFGKGKIFPHEETHTTPKIDRLNLMLETNAHFEHIFMLYSDPENRVNNILDKTTQDMPLIEVYDDFGELHKVWRVADKQTIAHLEEIFKKKELIIADGHHRYETGLMYKEEIGKRKPRARDINSANFVLTTLVNMDDVGLVIFPTHRLVCAKEEISYDTLKSKLITLFDCREYLFKDEQEECRKRIEMLEDLKIEGITRHCFGLISKNPPKYALLMLKDPRYASNIIKERHSDVWKNLDVNILHTLILENILGVGREQITREEGIDFARFPDEAIDKLYNKNFDFAFLLNPVKVSQLKEMVKNNERFPQKSTDFYPKLLSGLLMNKIEF